MNRHIFLQHEQPEASPGLLFFVGLLIALSALSIGVVMGFEVRSFLQREADKQAAEAAKMKPRPTVLAPQLIPCTPEGRIEHNRICLARMRSTRVGEK